MQMVSLSSRAVGFRRMLYGKLPFGRTTRRRPHDPRSLLYIPPCCSTRSYSVTSGLFRTLLHPHSFSFSLIHFVAHDWDTFWTLARSLSSSPIRNPLVLVLSSFSLSLSISLNLHINYSIPTYTHINFLCNPNRHHIHLPLYLIVINPIYFAIFFSLSKPEPYSRMGMNLDVFPASYIWHFCLFHIPYCFSLYDHTPRRTFHLPIHPISLS